MKKLITLLSLLPLTALANIDVGYDLGSDTQSKDRLVARNSLHNDFYVKYGFTKNFYTKQTLRLRKDKKLSYVSTFGATDHAGYLRPYAEVSYTSDGNKLDYDIGTSFNFFDSFVPYIEFDDYISSGGESCVLGIDYKLYKKVHFKTSYEVTNKGKGNNWTVGVWYELL